MVMMMRNEKGQVRQVDPGLFNMINELFFPPDERTLNAAQLTDEQPFSSGTY